MTRNRRDKKEVFDFTGSGTDPIYDSANRWPDGDDQQGSTTRLLQIEWAEFCSKRTDGDYANYGGEVQISQYRL